MMTETTSYITPTGMTVTTQRSTETRGNYVVTIYKTSRLCLPDEYSWNVRPLNEKAWNYNSREGYAKTLTGCKRSVTQAINQLMSR